MTPAGRTACPAGGPPRVNGVSIDLHTHSRVSDGTQSPAELVRAARAAGITVLGLTDHDTTAGWPEAADAAAEAGVTLVRGIEISTRHASGRGVHLLAYLPDPDHPGLAALLADVRAGREARVPAMLQKLGELGIEIGARDVLEVSGDAAATGRPHVADALVRLGVVADRDEAFATYLKPGRPAYVPRYSAPLHDAIAAVAAAGGVTVVAHPWGRHDPTALGLERFAELRDAGLSGIEVDHQDHDARARRGLREIAGQLDLVATGSSDHHGAGKTGHELGCNTTEPAQLERLLERAAAAATAAGRDVPAVLGG